ncbi:GDNF-inducible zinc finger protein 1-like isoform X2 [Pseudopipra pipra]|uniref:GDNF-inducible zinc finger protein 1-like isoform X2 n=1 Tax=Pseudopipra pipra TaxID=415032 RepID=UPI0031391F74
MCRMGKIIPQNWGSYPQCCSWIPGGEGGVIPAEGIYSSETFRSVPSFIFQTRGCTSEHPIGTGGGWARRVCVRVYTGAARCRRCKSPVSLLIKPSVPPSRVKLVFFRAGETPGFGNQKARGRAAARCLATGGAPVTSLPVRRGRAQGGRGRGASALPAAPGAEREQRPGTRREHAGNAPGTLLAGGRKMESAPVLLESKSSPINLLNEMHQLRLLGHLCDVTVSVEYQGVRAEFVAHKAVLAATSKFFKEVFLNEKAVDGPRSNVFLNEVQVADFASFLEFVYTARVEVEEDRVQRMLEIAEKLKCLDLSETCFQLKKQMLESVLLELQNFSESQNSEEEGAAHPSVPPESKAVAEAEQETPGSPVARPSHGASPEAPAAKSKEKTDKKKEMLKAPYAKIRRASGRLAGRKVFVEIPKKKYTRRLREQQKNAEVAAEDDKYPEDEELCDPEGEEERGEDAAAKPEGAGRDGSPEENRPKAGEDKKKRGSNFKCGTCEKEFLYEKSFLKHIQHSHGIAAELVFRCETCGQTFANRCNLRSHQRHVHSSERRFPCELCGKKFKRKKDVKRHILQVHEGGGERHQCQQCGKGLSSRTALRLHERTHTGHKPYGCPECEAKFSQPSALKTHMRIHTGEKPFVCDECGARFTQNHMLIYHRRCHTGEEPPGTAGSGAEQAWKPGGGKKKPGKPFQESWKPSAFRRCFFVVVFFCYIERDALVSRCGFPERAQNTR